MSLHPHTVRVALAPAPGYCVKSSALQQAIASLSSAPSRSDSPLSTRNVLAHASPIPPTLLIPLGIKIFVNIAWDPNVPPPPDGSEDAIQNAMSGESVLDDDALLQSGAWFVPVVVSEPRQDIDKGQLTRSAS